MLVYLAVVLPMSASAFVFAPPDVRKQLRAMVWPSSEGALAAELGMDQRTYLYEIHTGARHELELPFPKSMHVTLSEGEVMPTALARGGRLILVGDVHGCCDELELLLAKAGWERGRDRVVLLGDLVNKGPKSVEVVRLARRENFLAVRGNHDEAAVACVMATGRYADGYKAEWEWVQGLDADEVDWLREVSVACACVLREREGERGRLGRHRPYALAPPSTLHQPPLTQPPLELTLTNPTARPET